MDYKQFWLQDGLANIKPAVGGMHPEGWDPAEFLRELLLPLVVQTGVRTVLDFGCGFGRLCRGVPPADYLGIDLNPQAIAEAQRLHPQYSFREVDLHSPYPAADVVLAYTVFLHLDDLTLAQTLQRITTQRPKFIFIAEILGHEWRRGGTPPVFNRERREYEQLLQPLGYRLATEYRRPFVRYAAEPAFRDKNTDLSWLVFRSDLLPSF